LKAVASHCEWQVRKALLHGRQLNPSPRNPDQVSDRQCRFDCNAAQPVDGGVRESSDRFGHFIIEGSTAALAPAKQAA
jgi:hypothetical protein